jgi:hypothetical protein
MAIDTIHTRPNRTRTYPGVVDVSRVPTAQVEQLARDTDVHLERRGGRTYLVTAD